MFFWLGLGILSVVCLPYFRMLFKRLVLTVKLVVVCKKKRIRLHPTHFFWMLGRRDGTACDFHLETECEVWSVKLFGASCKSSVLHFKEDGSYFFRYRLYLIARIGNRVCLPFEGRVKRQQDWGFQKRFPETGKGKTAKSLLLIHPACCEIYYLPLRGPGRILCRGDRLGQLELEGLSGLIRSLNEK